jgi:hypothetical protein
MRLGIIITDTKVPVWAIEVIQELSRFTNVTVTIMIRLASNRNSDNISFRLFRKFDSLILSNKPELSEVVDFQLQGQALEINATPVQNKGYYTLTQDDLKIIRVASPDLILNFGSYSLQGEIAEIPKFGLWWLRFGDMNSIQPPPVGFWEWYYRTPVSRVSLFCLNDSVADYKYIAGAATRTELLSYGRNLRANLSMGIDLLLSRVANVANDNTLPNQPMASLQQANLTKRQPHLLHSITAVVKLISRLFAKTLRKLFFFDQWVLFYSFNVPDFPQLSFQKFKALVPPKDRIWADPFVISQSGKHYLFIEELLRKTNKGHISCMIMNERGEIEESKRIIDRPYHLSYPFIFQHESKWYMIPESAEGKVVDLFECTDFPFQWRFRRSLLTEVEAFDSTLHFHEGQFWLFCTIKKTAEGSSDDNLYLFHTKDLLEGEWLPHPNNPVVSDPLCARPAGRIFLYNNTLYRPSQICVPRYGYGLALNKILELTESTFKEETVSSAVPNWRKDLMSVHTLNFSNEITLIDGQLKRTKY